MNSEHNEQLQSLMSRAEESQRTFMEYQKSTMNDLNELSKLKSEVITLRTKLNLLESGDSHANEKIVSIFPPPPFYQFIYLSF